MLTQSEIDAIANDVAFYFPSEIYSHYVVKSCYDLLEKERQRAKVLLDALKFIEKELSGEPSEENAANAYQAAIENISIYTYNKNKPI